MSVSISGGGGIGFDSSDAELSFWECTDRKKAKDRICARPFFSFDRTNRIANIPTPTRNAIAPIAIKAITTADKRCGEASPPEPAIPVVARLFPRAPTPSVGNEDGLLSAETKGIPVREGIGGNGGSDVDWDIKALLLLLPGAGLVVIDTLNIHLMQF